MSNTIQDKWKMVLNTAQMEDGLLRAKTNRTCNIIFCMSNGLIYENLDLSVIDPDLIYLTPKVKVTTHKMLDWLKNSNVFKVYKAIFDNLRITKI